MRSFKDIKDPFIYAKISVYRSLIGCGVAFIESARSRLDEEFWYAFLLSMVQCRQHIHPNLKFKINFKYFHFDL